MTVPRLLLVGALVVLAGYVDGDRGALLALLGLALIALCTVLGRLVPPARSRLVASGDVDQRPRFPAYDRMYGAVLLSSTSARHVDLTLRPALQRVLASEIEDRGLQAVRERVGERLWALVDPDRPTSSDSRRGGLDRRALSQLLDRLENTR